MIGQLSPKQALMSISATTTVHYNCSRLPSSTPSGCSSTTNSILSSLLSCPDGAPTVLDCEYSADVVILYFLPTTINVIAATVYYDVSPPYTLTNNLSSYYSSIAHALVPPPPPPNLRRRSRNCADNCWPGLYHTRYSVPRSFQ